MSRSNRDKPFYVDVGTSIVAVRCASNHDVVLRYDHSWRPSSIELAETACNRMNKEAEIGRPRRNCDVGTEGDQAARFRIFCASHFDKINCKCGDCPAKYYIVDSVGCGIPYCQLKWAQMPYEAEEGGSK